MKRRLLLAAAAIVLVANALALAHVWNNRAGALTTDITLTECELAHSYDSGNDDSAVTFYLRRTDPYTVLYGQDRPPSWMNENLLQELGFDTSVAPSDIRAFDYYLRQRPRRGFVALEYDGPAWRKWIDDLEAPIQKQSLPIPYMQPTIQRESSTRLVAIDASSNAARLRTRHPDRGSVIIVPAVIRIATQLGNPRLPPRLWGYIQEIPSSIHVPRPFSESFQHLSRNRDGVTYRVHLRYGASLEPWIVGVEFPTPTR